MGGQIALAFALGGRPVRLWGRSLEKSEQARARIAAALDWLAGEGLVAAARIGEVLGRIEVTDDIGAAVRQADFVIEAVTENLDLKRDVLAQAEEHAAGDAILSSTTSAISATALQKNLERPGRFAVAHFAQPGHLMRLVEVVAGKATDAGVVDRVKAVLEGIGKVPVVAPDIPGFLWARIQHAILREFVYLVDRGLTTPEACDKVLKEGYAVRLPMMGSFEHADLAGIDLMSSEATRTVWADLSNERDPLETSIGKLRKAGDLGMSSGKGYYDWQQRDAARFRQQRDEEIVRRVKIQRGGTVVLAKKAAGE